MLDRSLRALALSVAALTAAVVAIAVLSEMLRQQLVLPLTWLNAGLGAILFLRMLFDRRVHQGIDAANREVQPLGFRRIRLFDPKWGLLGSRFGDRTLPTVRLLLLIEFIGAMPFGKAGGKDILLLAFAGTMIAMLLSLIQLGDNTAPAKDAV